MSEALTIILAGGGLVVGLCAYGALDRCATALEQIAVSVRGLETLDRHRYALQYDTAGTGLEDRGEDALTVSLAEVREKREFDDLLVTNIATCGHYGASWEQIRSDDGPGRFFDGAVLGETLDRLARAGRLETFKRDDFIGDHPLNGRTCWRVPQPEASA